MTNPSAPTETFAVVIPLYNHERYIAAAIDSVLSQTRPVEDIILIDDGSKDAGFSIAADLLANIKHSRVSSQVNAGAHITLNRAIASTNCEFIAVLNSDDIFLPGKIARTQAIFRAEKDVDLLVGGVQIIDGLGARVHSGDTVDWLNRAYRFYDSTGLIGLSLLHENFAVTTSNMVFRKELWRRNGGFQALRYCHDLDFLMASLLNGQIHIDSDKHIFYRVHNTNTIKDSLTRIRVEIAAVMANAFRECGHVLAGGVHAARTISALYELIKTKDLSNLALLLSAVRSSCVDREAFYSVVTNEALFKMFEMVLKDVPVTEMSQAVDLSALPDKRRELETPSKPTARPGGPKQYPLAIAIEVGSFDKGGLEKVVLDSAISFRQRGIQPIVVSTGPVGYLASVAASHGVEVIQLPVAGRDVFYAALLQVRGIKLAMSHFSRVGYKTFRKLGIPNITFIHNIYAMLAGDALRNFKLDDQFVERYISVSPKATRYASEKLGVDAGKIVTIPNGLILSEHREREQLSAAADRRQFGLKPNDYVFLNVASYNLHKGHYLMAQAMEIIRTKRSDIKLVCIGNEIYPPHVRQLKDNLTSRHLEDWMILPGFFADVAPFHKMADAFVLPSFIEGWSIAMNEAMFYKKPMILSDTGGASEVVENEDIGIVIENEYGDVTNLDAQKLDELAYSPRDYMTAPALANAMLRFASKSETWAAAGRLGHSKVVDRYDFSDVVDRYVETIHRSISGESLRALDAGQAG